jgi:hypothetical protein
VPSGHPPWAIRQGKIAAGRPRRRNVARRAGGPKKLLLLDGTYHMIAVDKQRNDVVRSMIEDFMPLAESGPRALPAGASVGLVVRALDNRAGNP